MSVEWREGYGCILKGEMEKTKKMRAVLGFSWEWRTGLDRLLGAHIDWLTPSQSVSVWPRRMKMTHTNDKNGHLVLYSNNDVA